MGHYGSHRSLPESSPFVMSSAKEDLESEGLITAEENAGQSESQTAESPPDSPPPVARVWDKLRHRLMTGRSEAHMNASHRNTRSTSPEF